MSTSLPDRTITAPEQQPRVPTPEREAPAPKRRRIHIPVFSTRGPRTFVLAAALAAGLYASAQSGTTTAAPQGTTTQQPPTQGWVMFDDRVSSTLSLQADQLRRLKDVDTKYRDRYTALGTDPWTNKGYTALTEERERMVKDILTPDQYNTWVRTYGSQRTTTTPAPQR